MLEHELNITTDKPTSTAGVFKIEPLERGMGHTLGNSLRRILLGQLSGAAVTKIKINNLPHEFSPIPGVTEDAVDLILNIKQIHFQLDITKPTIVTLEAKGEKEVTAGDLTCPTGVSVVNPDLHLATLSAKDSVLKLNLTVEYGTGYHLPQEGQPSKTVGEILLDADFSPVKQVSFHVESARVGRLTNFDRLVLEIATSGGLTPDNALKQAAAILSEHANAVAQFSFKKASSKTTESTKEKTKKVKPETYLEELAIPTRVVNILKKAGIHTVTDLKREGLGKLQEVKNIGPKTMQMVAEKLEEGD